MRAKDPNYKVEHGPADHGRLAPREPGRPEGSDHPQVRRRVGGNHHPQGGQGRGRPHQGHPPPRGQPRVPHSGRRALPQGPLDHPAGPAREHHEDHRLRGKRNCLVGAGEPGKRHRLDQFAGHHPPPARRRQARGDPCREGRLRRDRRSAVARLARSRREGAVVREVQLQHPRRPTLRNSDRYQHARPGDRQHPATGHHPRRRTLLRPLDPEHDLRSGRDHRQFHAEGGRRTGRRAQRRQPARQLDQEAGQRACTPARRWATTRSARAPRHDHLVDPGAAVHAVVLPLLPAWWPTWRWCSTCSCWWPS